jgi:shikimate dehydrogenase
VKRFLVVGDPIAHSLSPVMHRAAFAALGLDHTYDAERVEGDRLPVVLDRLRRGALAGLNVTVPHKVAVRALCDVETTDVARIEAANTLVMDATGRLVAHNTDAAGLRADLGALGLSPRRALVLGTGGAARAAIVALTDLGARVAVAGRDAQKAAGLARALGADAAPWSTLASPAAPYDLVVNATSAGMEGGPDGTPIAEAWTRAPRTDDASAYDLVYRPAVTPFAAVAGARGHTGLGMLVEQGVRALVLFLGQPVPAPVRAAMRGAVEAALERRGT